MSDILAVKKIHGQPSYWLILDCGHWYKWTGAEKRKPGQPFPCPACNLPAVAPPQQPEHG